ncbi:hypothetical protein F8S13_23915 [Chloroflexia bacterium SDU3-3]|nr:hypothetical protein F8S13_23915 [Chloroflexia bacterium SDU3-3]
MDFLARYRAGEREQVWAELVALGAAVREPPLYQDAQAVACEIMLRARYNIALLVERLQQLDFVFVVGAQGAWNPCTARELKLLASIEQRRGPLPIVLRAWVEMIGNVDLRGSHPTLSNYYSLGHATTRGPNSDPLVLGMVPYELSQLPCIDRKQQIFLLEVAPDSCHKSNYSGGGDSYMRIPSAGFDAPFGSDDWWDGMCLIPYLRECFAWGGFPGLRDDPAAAEAAREELAFLTQGLLPI